MTEKVMRCPQCGTTKFIVQMETGTDQPLITLVHCTGCGHQGAPALFEPKRSTYLVRWEIEVDAGSYLEAAEEAEEIQRSQVNRDYDENGDLMDPGVFVVKAQPYQLTQSEEGFTTVDLSEMNRPDR